MGDPKFPQLQQARMLPLPPLPEGTALEFWKGIARPQTWFPAFPKLEQMGAAPALELGQDLRAALTVLGGGEDPATTKKPAAKPATPKVNPVPVNAPDAPMQKPGPADDYDQMGAVDFPMNAIPPPSEPAQAPGEVRVRLADGREFDYGAGESIPIKEQGHFGPGRFEEQTNMGPGAGTREFSMGGTGHPGGVATSRTPESDLRDLELQAKITNAAAGAREAFPEIAARARAQEGVLVAQENARRAVDADRLAERIKSEDEAQALISQYEAARAAVEANVTRWEQYAEKTGDPEAAKRAAALREKFERESVAKKEVLDRQLSAKGLLRGAYTIRQP